MSLSRQLPDEQATERLGKALADLLADRRQGWLLLLEGELGAGKSTVARALLRRLGHTGSVPSPTYTLVEPYEFPEGAVYHIDLYRINGFDELEYLGWEDLRDGLVIVEWPQRAPELAAEADLRVALEYDGDGRAAVLEALSPKGAALLDDAKQLADIA